MIGRGLLRRWSREAPAGPMGIAPRVAARTHVGKMREINEDRFLVRSEQGLWAVADGMGGLTAGSEAAEAAVTELANLTDHHGMITEVAIGAALDRANRHIRRETPDAEARSGTTVVVAWLEGRRLSVFWIGDSRAYLLRKGTAQRLTHDHSVVQDLIDAGEITEVEAERHPYAHLVTRALGAAESVSADRVVVDLEAGDRLLLCSDGVSRSLDPEEAAGAADEIGTFADKLLGDALHRDGSDNATLIAIEIVASRSQPSSDGLSGGTDAA